MDGIDRSALKKMYEKKSLAVINRKSFLERLATRLKVKVVKWIQKYSAIFSSHFL